MNIKNNKFLAFVNFENLDNSVSGTQPKNKYKTFTFTNFQKVFIILDMIFVINSPTPTFR